MGTVRLASEILAFFILQVSVCRILLAKFPVLYSTNVVWLHNPDPRLCNQTSTNADQSSTKLGTRLKLVVWLIAQPQKVIA